MAKKQTEYDPARHLQALCCECGMLRHLNRKFYQHKNDPSGRYIDAPTNGYSTIGEPFRGYSDSGETLVCGYWQSDRRREPRLQAMTSPYDRYVCVADCAHCEGRTRHALIYPIDWHEYMLSRGWDGRDSVEEAMLAQGVGEPVGD